MVLNSENTGKESEWNEAMFKAKRLHEIQELINFFKMNPLGMTDNKFNYYWLLRNIEALYGEGQSKYSPEQKKQCEKLKDLCNKVIKFMPPHIRTRNENVALNNKQAFLFNQKNYDILIDILYDFEMKVKDLNDEHGLTTKNKGTAGLF